MKSPVWIAASVIVLLLIASTEARGISRVSRGLLRSNSPDVQCREGCANCFAFEACMRNHIYEAQFADGHSVLESAHEDCNGICDRRFLFWVY